MEDVGDAFEFSAFFKSRIHAQKHTKACEGKREKASLSTVNLEPQWLRAHVERTAMSRMAPCQYRDGGIFLTLSSSSSDAPGYGNTAPVME